MTRPSLFLFHSAMLWVKDLIFLYLLCLVKCISIASGNLWKQGCSLHNGDLTWAGFFLLKLPVPFWFSRSRNPQSQWLSMWLSDFSSGPPRWHNAKQPLWSGGLGAGEANFEEMQLLPVLFALRIAAPAGCRSRILTSCADSLLAVKQMLSFTSGT